MPEFLICLNFPVKFSNLALNCYRYRSSRTSSSTPCTRRAKTRQAQVLQSRLCLSLWSKLESSSEMLYMLASFDAGFTYSALESCIITSNRVRHTYLTRTAQSGFLLSKSNWYVIMSCLLRLVLPLKDSVFHWKICSSWWPSWCFLGGTRGLVGSKLVPL